MSDGTLKVRGMRAELVDGHPAIVLVAVDARGRETKVAIPANGWQAIFAEGARQIETIFNQSVPTMPGGWSQSIHRPGAPAQLGTTDDGKALLIACVGRPDEVSLSFDRQDALDLAQGLREIAETLPASPQQRN